jgi:hypothetical protein
VRRRLVAQHGFEAVRQHDVEPLAAAVHRPRGDRQQPDAPRVEAGGFDVEQDPALGLGPRAPEQATHQVA